MKAIILGKSGTGKTSVQKCLSRAGFIPCVSHTTRPRRNKEVEGIDYFFVDDHSFRAAGDKMIVTEFFPAVGWYYGKLDKEIEKADIILTTPGELQRITDFLDSIDTAYQIFLLEAPDETRRMRSITRGDSITEIERRIMADNKDFEETEKRKDIVKIETSENIERISAIVASAFAVKCVKMRKNLLPGKFYQIEDLIIPESWKDTGEISFTVINESNEACSYPVSLFQIHEEIR
jgi:guanylate kinase